MKSVHEIQTAICGLSTEELQRLRDWFASFDADAWDKEFEDDVTDGRLDSLADEALRELEDGHTTPL